MRRPSKKFGAIAVCVVLIALVGCTDEAPELAIQDGETPNTMPPPPEGGTDVKLTRRPVRGEDANDGFNQGDDAPGADAGFNQGDDAPGANDGFNQGDDAPAKTGDDPQVDELSPPTPLVGGKDGPTSNLDVKDWLKLKNEHGQVIFLSSLRECGVDHPSHLFDLTECESEEEAYRKMEEEHQKLDPHHDLE